MLITSFSLLLKYRNHSSVKDTTDFLNFIKKTRVAKDITLVSDSIDVRRLYTNIPHEEVITIVCNTYETLH